MKSENGNRISFTVRLNLNNSQHREAWEKLHNGAHSYTASIVDALTREETQACPLTDADMLKAIVRQAVSEAMHELPIATQQVGASSEIVFQENEGVLEISDDDYDIAEDFLSSLGC